MPVPETRNPALAEILSVIEEGMERVDRWLNRQFESETPALAPLLSYVSRFRGKRVRAAQVLLIAQALGEIREEHVQVAGIVEMIHAATLIHDDLLDEASRRRGLDCVHVRWGAHASVLLGDWIYARAFLRSTEMPDRVCSQAFGRATAKVCRGEILQNLTRGDFELCKDHYLTQIDGKTAALYETGGRLAAHYGGASPEVQEACARHGLLAGRAFQMIDDILDLEGTETDTGKSLGTDWARGKMTLPLIHLRDGLEGVQRDRLQALFGSGAPRSALMEHGFAEPLRRALAAAKGEAHACLQQAEAGLECLPDTPARRALRELTLFLGTRHR